jgi:hypothetical protein
VLSRRACSLKGPNPSAILGKAGDEFGSVAALDEVEVLRA